jgi:hypothetical protein
MFGAITVYAAGEIPSESPIGFIALFLMPVGAVAIGVSVALIASLRPLDFCAWGATRSGRHSSCGRSSVRRHLGRAPTCSCDRDRERPVCCDHRAEMLICSMFLEVHG